MTNLNVTQAQAIERFADNHTLEDSKKILWEQLKLALSSQDADNLDAQKRSSLMFFHENLNGLLDELFKS